MHEFKKRGNSMRETVFFSKKIALGLLFALALATVTGFVWGYKDVQVVADGNTLHVRTFTNRPEKILTQAGVVLGEKDEYRLSTKHVKDNTVLTVYRAVPVQVTYRNQKQQLTTGKPTVGEVLDALGIEGEALRVTPDRDTKITENVHIKVVETSQQVVQREEAEPFPIVRQPDPTMEAGNEVIVQAGENGRKSVKVELSFDDGVQVGEKVLEETVVQPARPQIVKVGARTTVDTSRGAMHFRRVAYMEATAYLPSDGNGAGITATGVRARRGIVAVDPRVIPLGTRLFVPGYGFGLAADTGGAIRGNIIDLCMEDYGEAMRFGRRDVKVYILE